MSGRGSLQRVFRYGHRHEHAGMEVTLLRLGGVTRPGILKQPLRFQVAPTDEMGWDRNASWQDFDTVEAGQFTRRGGGRQQRTVQLVSMIVDYNPSWAVWAGGRHHRPPDGTMLGGPTTRGGLPLYGDRHAHEAAEPGGPAISLIEASEELDRLLEVETPMRLRCWNRALHHKPDIDWPVTFRTFSVRERPGEPDARYFTCTFTEYRQPKTRRKGYGHNRDHHDLPARVKVLANGSVLVIELGGDDLDRQHQQRIGGKQDVTLRRLSRHFYGDPGDWKRIHKANGLKNIGPDEPLKTLLHGRYRDSKHVVITVPKRHHHDHHGNGGGNRWGGMPVPQ